MTARYLPVPDSLAGQRIDVVVARMLGLSRSAAATLADEGAVTVDGRTVVKSHRVVEGGTILVELPDPHAHEVGVETADAAAVPLTIVHLDEDVVVVDKPVGVAAHASPGWAGPTVTASLAAQGISVARVGSAEREGVVHRLDVGTSGLMVVARSAAAYRSLKEQFRDRSVEKVYHALVQGHPDPSSGTIDAPIDRHPTADHRFAVVSGGKPSITHYDTVEAFPYATLVEVHLKTGRTHQIRVHFAALRHPCCGDLTYGADPVLAKRLGLQRQWLHATELEFTHPATGDRVRFASEYPEDLAEAIEVLRRPLT
ncbi:MAG: RluA family pseudouridine synthase [Actinobacteria bacterium]|nr:RluA family pseudouridine synthase [Actinomycetota bacterium]MCB9412317.1 RluA family pseudouridine synthase [Actinomycetota bacterium]